MTRGRLGAALLAWGLVLALGATPAAALDPDPESLDPDPALPSPAELAPLLPMPGIAPLSATQAVKPAPRPRARTQPPLAAAVDPGGLATAAPRLGYEPAPVPNRSLEAPRALDETARQDKPSLTPSILYKNLPTPNQAAQGAPSHTEERLFAPGPGARLKVPFSY